MLAGDTCYWGAGEGICKQESCVHRIIFGVFRRTLDQRGR